MMASGRAALTIEIILLALASSIRPTSLAAVYALLAAEGPRRLMLAYVISGLAFTIVFGLLVVGVLQGISLHTGSDRTRGVAEIVAGVVLLGFALLVHRRRIAGPRADDAPNLAGGWTARLEQHLTLPRAALAGPLTHIPGLFYLVALNVIITHHPKAVDAIAEILLYNAIWFALPIVALALCIVRPGTAHDVVGAVAQFAAAHTREILLVVSTGAGAALLIRGILAL